EIRDFAPDLNFGVTLIPERKPGSGHRSWGGGFDIEIPKGSDHPEAAWKFVKFMTSKKPQKYWATHTFDNVANIAAAEATAKSSDLSKEEQMVYSMAAKSVEHNVMTPRPLKAPNFTNKVNPILDNSLHGKIPPQQAVEKAQKLVEKLLQGN
ncbi:MAG TPA: extracellular solute-binding protein, partial [Bacillales bacterium]